MQWLYITSQTVDKFHWLFLFLVCSTSCLIICRGITYCFWQLQPLCLSVINTHQSEPHTQGYVFTIQCVTKVITMVPIACPISKQRRLTDWLPGMLFFSYSWDVQFNVSTQHQVPLWNSFMQAIFGYDNLL